MQIIFRLDSICKAQGAGRYQLLLGEFTNTKPSSRDDLDHCIQLNNASMGKRVYGFIRDRNMYIT